jgi:phosphoribosyl 1,2-cyclic phosphate phosphodiesterase
MAEDVRDELLVRYPPMVDRKFDISVHILRGPFCIGDHKIVPIPIMHGRLKIHGFRIGSAAYITDAKEISAESYALLKGVRELVINGLRRDPHPTHFGFDQMLDAIERIGPEKAFAIHMNHDLGHEDMMNYFAEQKKGRVKLDGTRIEPAYDGLEFEFDSRMEAREW